LNWSHILFGGKTIQNCWSFYSIYESIWFFFYLNKMFWISNFLQYIKETLRDLYFNQIWEALT
jgi:hypothetical protein